VPIAGFDPERKLIERALANSRPERRADA